MSREVWLTVTGDQKDSDGNRDRNAVSCRASYESCDGSHVFTYRERYPESGAVTESRMVFSESFCRIDRKGAVHTSMYFSPMEESECGYETGFGTFLMKIYTKHLAMKQVGGNFHARVSYTLCLQGGVPMECAVTVKAEPLCKA